MQFYSTSFYFTFYFYFRTLNWFRFLFVYDRNIYIFEIFLWHVSCEQCKNTTAVVTTNEQKKNKQKCYEQKCIAVHVLCYSSQFWNKSLICRTWNFSRARYMFKFCIIMYNVLFFVFAFLVTIYYCNVTR